MHRSPVIKSLTYIFPSSPTHFGLKIKYEGQKKAFNELGFTTTAFILEIPKNTSIIKKIGLTLSFLIKSLISLRKTRHAYIRYNPKMILLNYLAITLARRKKIIFEHNINYENELNLLNRPLEKKLHLIQLSWFKKANCFHAPVTQEIGQMLEKRGVSPKKIHPIQNGFSLPHYTAIPTTPSRFTKWRNPSVKLGIMISSGYRWHGIPEIVDLIKNHPIQVIIVGPFSLPTTSQVLCLGPQEPDLCHWLLNQSDFGIGAFKQELLGLTEASPLKTREYLCHGLPIWINYTDSASNIPSLAPYIFNQKTTPNALIQLLELSVDKPKLADLAQTELSWTAQLRPLLKFLT